MGHTKNFQTKVKTTLWSDLGLQSFPLKVCLTRFFLQSHKIHWAEQRCKESQATLKFAGWVSPIWTLFKFVSKWFPHRTEWFLPPEKWQKQEEQHSTSASSALITSKSWELDTLFRVRGGYALLRNGSSPLSIIWSSNMYQAQTHGGGGDRGRSFRELTVSSRAEQTYQNKLESSIK